MTFRSETETLRARVEELEREKADLAQAVEASRGLKRKPLFDPLRLFRRIAWFLLASTEWNQYSTGPPTRWGFFAGTYVGVTIIAAGFLMVLPPLWIITVPTLAVLLTLPLLRVWLRYGMRLDDHDSKSKWEKRFE